MKAHELLGMIMVREGILSTAQLQQALDEQQRLRELGRAQPFGVVVMQLGIVSEGQIRHALRLQKKLAWAPDAPTPLHVRLIEGGVVSPSLVVSLMEESERHGEPLDELLVHRQAVQPAVIAYFRQRQP